jgi:bifunctional N-acetylglucosamine-1-phosphate-uridyltransferase/glucosamine-1-phosphate-acetyltransferase GlmU-like protein
MRDSRVLIVPAAGLGSRLGAGAPKLLVPVAGVPMVDRILDLYRDRMTRAVIVVNPAFADAVRRHLGSRSHPFPIECVEQAAPTGMLDAILLAAPAARKSTPSSIWITWCDQVAVHASTIERLSAVTARVPHAAVVLPTVQREHPYIHFERDASGRITRVRHRREGDPMPPQGESDIGLFALSAGAYAELLPRYAREVEIGGATGERNFLPFIPWVARDHEVATFPCTNPMEAIGVNTPEELKAVEAYLIQGRPA